MGVCVHVWLFVLHCGFVCLDSACIVVFCFCCVRFLVSGLCFELCFSWVVVVCLVLSFCCFGVFVLFGFFVCFCFVLLLCVTLLFVDAFCLCVAVLCVFALCMQFC